MFRELATQDTRGAARRIAAAAVPALLVWGACVLALQTLPGRRAELLEFDLLSVATAPGRVDAPIVIVGIDEPSFAELKQQWPWPRELHARLVEALRAAGAAVIAFDVLFAEPSTPEGDARLAEAIKRAGKVVLASDLVFQESGQYRQLMQIEPLALLREAGARSGVVTVSFDPDRVVRSIPREQNAFWREVLRAFRGPRDAGEAELPGGMARYLGPDHAFRYVSYYQALEPEKFLPPGIFRGKIVLVGNDVKVSFAPGSGGADAFATPHSGVTRFLTPGVEVHATFIANALSGRAIREAPPPAKELLIAVAVLLTAIGIRQWKALRSTLLLLGLIVAIAAGTAWLFAARDLWLLSTGALLAAVAMYVVQVATGFFRERRQRRQIEGAFRHYVAPEIVKEMTEHPERLTLGGVRRDMTVLFADLAGFTGLSERMNPEQVASLLNEFLTAMTRVVHAHGGTLDKFIGDAVMAFWGAPLADAEQALHACQAAIGMQAELSALRSRLAERGSPQLRMRIGIHSGAAVVGNMGSSDRFAYTAIGDNVNLASRLEGVNKHYGTEVLVSGDTATQVLGRIPLRRVDRVIVKGRTQPVEIYSFCDDEERIRLSERALGHYLQHEWEQADAACRALLERYPEDTIARLFRDRIEQLRRDPPAPEWNGCTSLEKL